MPGSICQDGGEGDETTFLSCDMGPPGTGGHHRDTSCGNVRLNLGAGDLGLPYLLELAHPNGVVTALSDIGLSFLMVLAGHELELSRLNGRPMRLATVDWLISLALALGEGRMRFRSFSAPAVRGPERPRSPHLQATRGPVLRPMRAAIGEVRRTAAQRSGLEPETLQMADLPGRA